MGSWKAKASWYKTLAFTEVKATRKTTLLVGVERNGMTNQYLGQMFLTIRPVISWIC